MNTPQSTCLSLVLALLTFFHGEAQTERNFKEVKVPNVYRYYKGISRPAHKTLTMRVLIAVYWGNNSGRKKRVKNPKLEGHVVAEHKFSKKIFEERSYNFETSYKERRITKHFYH